jgi:hypothetical protein
MIHFILKITEKGSKVFRYLINLYEIKNYGENQLVFGVIHHAYTTTPNA